MTHGGEKIAVVLFNLGGPDRLESVVPFLVNLFADPAIIGAPGFIRVPLAHFIARRRGPVAREIYRHIGGKSPLLEQTEAQGAALEKTLQQRGYGLETFVCMRYWHPMSDQVAAEVKAYDPQRIVLLPLYPQFSTTTTGSSIEAWRQAAKRIGLKAEVQEVCCYPCNAGLIAAMAGLVADGIRQARQAGRPRVLFSAHGLPKKVIAKGDPYQWQVERTAQAVVGALVDDDFETVVCYQSKVGPLPWIGPSTEDEIIRAGNDGVPVVVVPIAFVSEHSETLVELDIEYRQLALEKGVPFYVRVPTVGVNSAFIEGLADLIEQAVREGRNPHPEGGRRICPVELGQCYCRRGERRMGARSPS